MNNTLVVHDAFKDVIKLIGNSFEIRPEIYTNNFSAEHVQCEISYYDDRTLFNIYALNVNFQTFQVMSLTFYRDRKTTRIRIHNDCVDFSNTTYFPETNMVHISKQLLEPFYVCKLNYPLQEEQIFQEMTLFPVPPEEDIQKFMDLGEYILGSNTNFKGYGFSCYEYIEVQDSLLEIVQEVQECVLQLIAKEELDGYISS